MDQIASTLSLAAVTLFLALGTFVFRRLVLDAVWSTRKRIAFSWIAEFARSLAATLISVTLLGFIIDQVDGVAFDFDAHGIKLLGAASLFFVTGLLLAVAASVSSDGSG